MISYLRTEKERNLMVEADHVLSAAAFPSKGWKEVPGSPFYLFLMGVHLLLFHPAGGGRAFTLSNVMHRVWGRVVPHSTLTDLFTRSQLRVRPYQLALLYRATAIIILIRLGATVKEVRSILSLSPHTKVYTMLGNAEAQMGLPAGTLIRWARVNDPAPTIAKRALRTFMPSDKPDHAAWWLTTASLSRASRGRRGA